MLVEALPRLVERLQSGVYQLFDRGGPARRTAIEAQLDGQGAVVVQAEDPTEARQNLANNLPSITGLAVFAA